MPAHAYLVHGADRAARDPCALDRAASETLLRRPHVGRIAFAHHERVAIRLVNYVLVNYVLADDWIDARRDARDDVATLRDAMAALPSP